MYQTQSFHPASPLLGRYEPSLPAVSYYDPAWFEREQKQIWARNWVYAGRSNDLPAMTMRRLSVAGQNLILVQATRTARSRAFTIPAGIAGRSCAARRSAASPRGSSSAPITSGATRFQESSSGRPLRTLTDDFRKGDYGLFPVHVREWNGFVFVCLADNPPDFSQGAGSGRRHL